MNCTCFVQNKSGIRCLIQEQDEFRWNLSSNGQFTVKSHYLALIHSDVPYINKRLWKLMVPLKVKVFLWYLRRGVVLTKDNLAKRNWQGNQDCCFCHCKETIKHLFFECHFARSVWTIIHVASGIRPPHHVSHMFSGWLTGVQKDLQLYVLLGAAATCWSLWLCRNDMIFDSRKVTFSHLQVVFSIIHWLRTWVILQKPGLRDLVIAGCLHLKQVVRECFTQGHGWRSSLRIDGP